jgi:hypothetical protein
MRRQISSFTAKEPRFPLINRRSPLFRLQRSGLAHYVIIHLLLLVGAVILVIAMILAFYDLYHNVPTVDSILRDHSEFVYPNAVVEGIYANSDVNCKVFKFRMPTSNVDTRVVADAIRRAGIDAGWKIMEETDARLHFTRCDALRSTSKWRTAQEFAIGDVRVILPQVADDFVYVCYVQGVSNMPLDNIEETDTGHWAASQLWPLFESAAGSLEISKE